MQAKNYRYNIEHLLQQQTEIKRNFYFNDVCKCILIVIAYRPPCASTRGSAFGPVLIKHANVSLASNNKIA